MARQRLDRPGLGWIGVNRLHGGPDRDDRGVPGDGASCWRAPGGLAVVTGRGLP
jgi:hypothetical protein